MLITPQKGVDTTSKHKRLKDQWQRCNLSQQNLFVNESDNFSGCC
jgi:hypothetical protein